MEKKNSTIPIIKIYFLIPLNLGYNVILYLFITIKLNIILQLKDYDKEQQAFENTLAEYPVTFPPSYPFEENIFHATNYMQTRCPAWCDRVLLSKTAKKLISETDNIEYNLMGLNACMGDHKVMIIAFI